jgi:hypothetical protein
MTPDGLSAQETGFGVIPIPPSEHASVQILIRSLGYEPNLCVLCRFSFRGAYHCQNSSTGYLPGEHRILWVAPLGTTSRNQPISPITIEREEEANLAEAVLLV